MAGSNTLDCSTIAEVPTFAALAAQLPEPFTPLAEFAIDLLPVRFPTVDIGSDRVSSAIVVKPVAFDPRRRFLVALLAMSVMPQ